MTISIGDRITGRCVTIGIERTGVVLAVTQPQRYSGDSSPRYTITDETDGRMAVVEVARPASTR